MYPVTQAFIAAQQAGERPVVLAFLGSRMGNRVYGKTMPTAAQMGNAGGLVIYDGTVSVGDETIFGSANIVISWGPLAVAFGSLRETLTPEESDVLIGLAGAEIPQITVTFDNTEQEFSDILAEEDFLGQTLRLRLGYPSLSYTDFVQVFSGTVIQKRIDAQSLTLTMDAGQFDNLKATYFLGKSSRYANPERDNELLPVVLGDCTINAGKGTVKAICIDTVNHYYLFADHAVLSEANGNVITVYEDGVEVTSGVSVTTSGTDENGRTIAYLTFTAAPEGEITVSCKGLASGSTLYENPVEVLEQLLDLMEVNDDLNASMFARAEQIADEQAWKAAKVIQEEQAKSQHVQDLVSSFLGDWWYNSQGELVISFDFAAENVSYNIAGILNDSLCSYEGLQDGLINIVNQPIAYYAPDAEGDFIGFDDGESHVNILSQQIYGVRSYDFTFDWIRSDTVIDGLLEIIAERFASPPRILNLTESSFLNCHVERGDYVLAGYNALRDEQGEALKNQIWRVMEIEKNLDAFTIHYLLQDTESFWPDDPIIYDGTYSVGSYAGRTRNRRDLW